jgi:hypothetical protein
MRKGVDKFDLRDDEWMMVEDELLQTAKIFTRHLHLAEYERMKVEMEERAKNAAARPVVPDAKPSGDGRFKKRAEQQTKSQKKALRDFFTAASDDDEDLTAKNQKPASHTAQVAISKPRKEPAVLRLRSNHKDTSDSEDLDAIQRPKKQSAAAEKVASATADTNPAPAPTEFIKPALPTNSRTRAKPRRPTPFDMWDDFTPNRSSSPPKQADASTSHRSDNSNRQSSAPKPKTSSTSSSVSSTPPPLHTKAPARSSDLFSDPDSRKRDNLSKGASDRLAKRKAEKGKESQSKSSKHVDDIPTFLF